MKNLHTFSTCTFNNPHKSMKQQDHAHVTKNSFKPLKLILFNQADSAEYLLDREWPSYTTAIPLSPRWAISLRSREIRASELAFHVRARHSDTRTCGETVVFFWSTSSGAFCGAFCGDPEDLMNSVAPTLGCGFPEPEFFATIVIRAVMNKTSYSQNHPQEPINIW